MPRGILSDAHLNLRASLHHFRFWFNRTISLRREMLTQSGSMGACSMVPDQNFASFRQGTLDYQEAMERPGVQRKRLTAVETVR